MKAQVAYHIKSLLGEGPVWNAQEDAICWVDIEKGELHFLQLGNQQRRSFSFEHRLGVAVPTDKGRFLLALQNGLALFTPSNRTLEYFANPEETIPQNRFNDGKCDDEGRFWVGSMDINATQEKGALYTVDSTLKPIVKLNNLTIANGIAWNFNSSLMYFIDTASHSVKQFDYNLKTAKIDNPKEIIKVPENYGAPDGMCIDVEGMLWIAHWGGANVSRWNPKTGKLLQKVQIPAPHVTSCCFGGENLDALFITTARVGLSQKQLEEYPLSGSLFSIKPTVKGMGTNLFKEL